MSVFILWLKFALCAFIIFFLGSRLARYGEEIAEKTGLGRVWVGVLFLAFITSLPEVATSVSASALVRDADLALGTLVGSNLFNLAILGIVELALRRGPLLSSVRGEHETSALFSLLLVGLAAAGVFLGTRGMEFGAGGMSFISPLMLALYLLGLRRIRSLQEFANAEGEGGRFLWFKFALCGIGIVAGGIWLSHLGEEIASTMEWGENFVGNLFLALTSSLPELAVTGTAVRIGAFDIAVANVFGSNMFNMAMVLPADLAYPGSSLFAKASWAHLPVAGVVMFMTFLTIMGLRVKAKGKVGWYAPLLVGLFVVGNYLAFLLGLKI